MSLENEKHGKLVAFLCDPTIYFGVVGRSVPYYDGVRSSATRDTSSIPFRRRSDSAYLLISFMIEIERFELGKIFKKSFHTIRMEAQYEEEKKSFPFSFPA